MAENSPLYNDLDEITALYQIRAEMQHFCQNEDDEFARIGVLSAYDKLLDNDDSLREKINSGIQKYIFQRLTLDEFNYFQFKTSSEKEDKKRRSNTNKSKVQNAETALIRKQIREEFVFLAKQKEEFKGLENAEILSVSVNDGVFSVKIAGQRKPLELKQWIHQNKHFSYCGMAAFRAGEKQKFGLDNKGYKLIASKGEAGFLLQELDTPEDLGKKYTPAIYRVLLGLESTAKLSPRQKDELEFLNKLTLSDQKNFVEALKKRKETLKIYNEIAEFVTETPDKISFLIKPEKLRGLLKQKGVNDFVGNMQKQFIHHIQKNSSVWNNFVKDDEDNNRRFSRYEILRNNLIVKNSDLFAELYSDEEDLHSKIKKAFTKIRHLAEIALPDGLCAEIIALGIFKEGLRNTLSGQKLNKMNKLLNEFGINIAFKTLPVTKTPPAEIANASEQNKIDRLNFENLKRTQAYQDQEKLFVTELKAMNISKAGADSTHHYIALKYNGFVDAELNDNANLVKTVRKNPWNYDGHDTTHLFDTAGEFLIRNESGEYSIADFNRLRNRFNQGEKMEIQAPVLQTGIGRGEFRDLLALENNGNSGHYVSDDNTLPIIKVPEYAAGGIVRSFTLTMKNKVNLIKAEKFRTKVN